MDRGRKTGGAMPGTATRRWPEPGRQAKGPTVQQSNSSVQPSLMAGHWENTGGSPDSCRDKSEPALNPRPQTQLPLPCFRCPRVWSGAQVWGVPSAQVPPPKQLSELAFHFTLVSCTAAEGNHFLSCPGTATKVL